MDTIIKEDPVIPTSSYMALDISLESSTIQNSAQNSTNNITNKESTNPLIVKTSKNSLLKNTSTDDLLHQLTVEDLIIRIKSLEVRNRKLLYANGCLVKDVNHHLASIESIKKQNNQIIDENNELQELCCFLDNERSKARMIAREWQTFTTYMRNDSTNYSVKVSRLERIQSELIRENFELKKLCLLLDSAINGEDEEYKQMNMNTNNAHYNNINNHQVNNGSGCGYSLQQTLIQQHRKEVLNPQLLGHIRSLERRIKQYEFEKKQWASDKEKGQENLFKNNDNNCDNNRSSPSSTSSHCLNCPEFLTESLQVLNILEWMEKNAINNTDSSQKNKNDNEDDEIDLPLDKQKALINGLCNVIWKKIEDGS